jgi:hypothetical protein
MTGLVMLSLIGGTIPDQGKARRRSNKAGRQREQVGISMAETLRELPWVMAAPCLARHMWTHTAPLARETDRLLLPEYQALIGGDMQDAAPGRHFETRDPGEGAARSLIPLAPRPTRTAPGSTAFRSGAWPAMLRGN